MTAPGAGLDKVGRPRLPTKLAGDTWLLVAPLGRQSLSMTASRVGLDKDGRRRWSTRRNRQSETWSLVLVDKLCRRQQLGPDSTKTADQDCRPRLPTKRPRENYLEGTSILMPL